MSRSRAALLFAAALALAALPFVLATTFTGDDHVFLAFARHAPSPLVPFVVDQHGGEYYRPVPMMLWWLQGRAGSGAAWPFATLNLLLHFAVAAGVGALLLAWTPAEERRRRLPAALLAAALFLLAPATRDAALWFSASTDLLATAGVLGAILLLLAGHPALSSAVALAAYLSKESAFVLPLLAYLCLRVRRRQDGRRVALSVLPHVVLAAAAFVLRRMVIGSFGGAADSQASLPVKAVHLLAGLAQEVTGLDLVSEPLAWVGAVALPVLAFAMVRAHRRGDRGALLPALWMGAAVLPLLAAGWPSGSRYFYLAAVGMAWAAADALLRAPHAVLPLVLSAVIGLGLAQTVSRHDDIASYRSRVDAVRRAVLSGASHGHRVFHVDGGVKDIELAVKGWTGAVPGVSDDELVVLGDVPASFAYLTPVLSRRLPFVVARPPIPPSGAYRFGAASIVGLVRRGDEPGLDEVLAAVPEIRFIRLRRAAGRRVIGRDVTEQLKSSPDPE